MKKIVNIVVGWWFWWTNQHDFLAANRLQICAQCPHRRAFICGKCGCVLQAKARLREDYCPDDRW